MNPLDNAWRIHAAQMEWTGRVDAKAGFILTLDAAAIATAVALSAEGMIFRDIHATWLRVPYGFSLFMFIVAALLAAWVVAPALRPANLAKEAEADFIYFGHAQYWKADDLAAALQERDPLPAVARQVVRMSQIAWEKHQKVAWAAWLTGWGVALIAVTGWASH